MEIIIIAILIGLIPACIARSKGRSFIAWWAYGSLLFIAALPHSLIMKPDQESVDKRSVAQGNKICPFCAETVKGAAVVCRYCGRDLPQPAPADPPDPNTSAPPKPTTDFEISL